MLLAAVLALAVSVARPGEAATPNDGEVLAALAVDIESAEVLDLYLDVSAVSEMASIDGPVDGLTRLAPQPAAGPSSQLGRELPTSSEGYDVLKEPRTGGTAGLTRRAEYSVRPSAFVR